MALTAWGESPTNEIVHLCISQSLRLSRPR